MTIHLIAGIAMLAATAGAWIAWIVVENGWKTALFVLGSVSMLVMWIAIATWLMQSGLS